MKNKFLFLMVNLLCGFLIFLATPAFAVPNLQLDIVGDHYYDTTTQTIVATDSTFIVRALLDNTSIDDTYYLSMAILPSISNPLLNLGSFIFDTKDIAPQTIEVVGGMTYGTPPEWVLDCKDLPSHGVFDTYYYLESFSFDSSYYVDAYNTQTDIAEANNDLYYYDFDIDVSDLDPSYILHFDLFNLGTYTKKGVQYQYVKDFAPFSHDAEGNPVPEPATVLLLGLGLIGLAGFRKRFRKN